MSGADTNIRTIGMICAMVLISLVSCIETSEPSDPNHCADIFTATVNDRSWEACPYTSLNWSRESHFSIQANFIEGGYLNTESMSIASIPVGQVGTYALGTIKNDSIPYMGFFYVDHDVLLAVYGNEEGDRINGSITMSSFDQETGEIEGSFETTLYLQKNYNKPGAPDSLVIEDGYFLTKLVD